MSPSLATGETLAHYRILGWLGSGGMGEVYKALDTKLDRIVALKLLPPEGFSHPERLQRLIREARAASALDHPNIVTIHDVVEANGRQFIVMQHVSGRSLREFIGQAEIREVLRYAAQIADGLTAAHAQGILHRDLKPDNIVVGENGVVKILDFGLAKLVEPLEQSEAPTRERALSSEEGHIAGTPAYMSPEQVQGKKLDTRSDIFSFGSILYEMVTGRQPFAGETAPLLMASIVRDEPVPVSEIVPGVPAGVEKIITRALRKDPERRWQSISDVKVELVELKEELDSGRVATLARGAHVPARRARPRWPPVLAGVLLLGAAGAWLYFANPETPSPATPLILPLTTYPGYESDPALSPDGKHVAFLWDGGSTQTPPQLYLRLIGGGEPLQLTKARSRLSSPAWSPDGAQIAFLRCQEINEHLHDIFVIPALGGPERRLGTSLSESDGLSWSPDGKVLAIVDRSSPEEPDAVFLLPMETGGEKRRLTSPPEGIGGDVHPVFSPDGTKVAFARVRLPTWQNADIYVQGLTSTEPQRLTFGDEPLWDLDWLPDGTGVIYSSGRRGTTTRLYSIASSAQQPSLVPEGENVREISTGRTASRLVYTQNLDDHNIWRIGGPASNEPGAPRQLIASTRLDWQPQYSPDGMWVAFASNRSGAREIWICDAAGASCRQITSLGHADNPRWSPDGRRIVFFGESEKGNPDIHIADVDGSSLRRLTDYGGNDGSPCWSRDGKWVYFASNRTGSVQLWKVRVSGGEPQQITKSGGVVPYESEDGRFLYYSKEFANATVWRVPVDGGDETLVLDQSTFALNWTIWRTKLVFLRDESMEGGASILSYDLTTGRVEEIARLPTNVPKSLGISVSPDGRWILYSQIDVSGSDLVLVEDLH